MGIVVDDICKEFAFLLDDVQDLFLNGVFEDNAVGEDGFVLADAVGAVDCLVFDGGIPPRVEEEDVVGTCGVRPVPAALRLSRKTIGSLDSWKA